MITSLNTGAGQCLVRAGKQDEFCGDCLQTRLSEAGFDASEKFQSVQDDDVPPELLDTLANEDPRVTPVVRLAGEGGVIHHLLPVPNCPSCGGGRRGGGADLPGDYLFDPLLGIASSLQVSDMERDPQLLCSAAAGRIHMSEGDLPETAHGQAVEANLAVLAQRGEAVERYAAFRPDHRALVFGAAEDLGDQTLRLTSLSGYDDEQRRALNYRRVSKRTRLAWIGGQRLDDGHDTLVPAACVFLRRTWPTEPRFGALVSHGLAAQRSVQSATQSAMLELIERHRLTQAWHRQSWGAFVDPAVLPPTVSSVVERIREAGLELHLRLLQPPPAIPVVLCVLSSSTYPFVASGAAARRAMPEAAARALVEAAGGWQHRALTERGARAPTTLGPMVGAAMHARYYADRRRARALVATLEPSRGAPASTSDSERSTADVESELCSLAPDASVVLLSPPDCEACGFHVVRIVAPWLPLFQFGSVGTPKRNLRRHKLPDCDLPHPYP